MAWMPWIPPPAPLPHQVEPDDATIGAYIRRRAAREWVPHPEGPEFQGGCTSQPLLLDGNWVVVSVHYPDTWTMEQDLLEQGKVAAGWRLEPH